MRNRAEGLRKTSAAMGGSTQAAEKLSHLLSDVVPVTAVFLLCLGTAAWLIFRIRARFRDREDSAEDAQQMLLQLGELRREGGLSQEEYRSIKGRLTQRLDDSARRSGPDGLTGREAASEDQAGLQGSGQG
jgi:hypothetical protein